MNRERFEQLLEAYGADMGRWPAEERAAGEAFAAAQGADAADALRAARALDAALDGAASADPSPALASRILAAAPRPRVTSRGFDRRAGWALAACAILGVALGFGGGMLAPVSDSDDSYFAAAFEAPAAIAPGDEG